MIGWSVETLIATTLLMLLVLAIRSPMRRAFGPQTAYALWTLPLVRLLMPPLPGEWQLSALLEPFVRGVEVMNDAALPAGLSSVAAPARFDLASMAADVAMEPPLPVASGASVTLVLLALWIAGAIMFLAYHLLSHRRFCADLLRAARTDLAVAKGDVRVIETDAADGPLAFGVFRKYVAFPGNFAEQYDEQERGLALAHELGHHARGDLLANWVALLVLAMHWFNPVAWRAFRAFRADQEMACDALVLAGHAQTLSHAYGRAIVKSARGGAVSAACHLHTINDVKGRLRMLAKIQTRSRARIAAGRTGVAAIALVALALSASGTQAADTLNAEARAGAGFDVVQVAPVAPAVPAVRAAAAAPAAPAASESPLVPPAVIPEATVPTLVRSVVAFGVQGDPAAANAAMNGKRVTKIVIVRADGSQTEQEIPDASIPRREMRSEVCGPTPDNQPTMEYREEGGKLLQIICTDRMALSNAQFERRMAERGETQAMMSLRVARGGIERDQQLSPSERAAALKGMDDAIAAVTKKAN